MTATVIPFCPKVYFLASILLGTKMPAGHQCPITADDRYLAVLNVVYPRGIQIVFSHHIIRSLWRLSTLYFINKSTDMKLFPLEK